MKSPLSNIKELVDTVAPYITNNQLIPKGILYHADPLFSGDLYYSSFWGDIPKQYIFSNNVFTLTENVSTNYNELVVDTILPYLENNMLLMVGNNNDIVLVTNINEDTNTITTTPGKEGHIINEKIHIFGKQCLVISDYDPLIPNKIDIQTDFPVIKGMTIIVIRDAYYKKYIKYEITEITHQYTIDNYYRTECLVDDNIVVQLTYGDFIYMESYPCYISKTIKTPRHFTTGTKLGPFYLDYMTAEMTDTEVAVYCECTCLDGNDNILIQKQIKQNEPVLYANIDATSFVFGDLSKGTATHTLNNEFVGQFNDNGLFEIVLKFPSQIMPPNDLYWEFYIEAPSNIYFYTELYNNMIVRSNITGTVRTKIKITPDSTKPLQTIILGGKGTPNSYFIMSDWYVNKETAKLQYNIIAKTLNQNNILFSDLLFKPMFPVIDDLTLKYDQNYYDNGKIYI